jgi:signal transduction histidine kinase
MLSASDAYTELFRFCTSLRDRTACAVVQVVAVFDTELLIVFSSNDAEEDARTPVDADISVCAEVARSGAPSFVPDVSKQKNYWPLAGTRILWEYCHPLVANGRVYALLNLEGSLQMTRDSIALIVKSEIENSSPGILLAIAATAAVRHRNKSADDDVANLEAMLKNEFHRVNKVLHPIGERLDFSAILLSGVDWDANDHRAKGVVARVASELNPMAQSILQLQRQILHWENRFLVRGADVHDCREEIDRAVEQARIDAAHQAAGTEFIIEVDSHIPKFRCFNLREIIGNCIMNALEAMARASGERRIEIFARLIPPDPEAAVPAVSIRIADTGPGFESVVLRRDPFSSTSTRGPGRGSGIRFAESRLKRTGVGASLKLRNRSDRCGAEVEIIVPVVSRTPGAMRSSRTSEKERSPHS